MKTYRFDQYVKDSAVEPFRLEVGPDDVIEILAPSGDTILQVEEAVSSRQRLMLLCGDQYERVMELIGPQPSAVLRRLSQDMARHFSVDPGQAPVGGFGASSS